ncbi:MAG TPA: phosphotransferase [Mycobacteriales bacterium]|nr:phosphotransferase [Mycobacteriales bacterium]
MIFTVDVDLSELSRAVGREVSTYAVEPIEPDLRLHSVTGGVYRVHGEDFSIVIKVVRRGIDEDPDALWVSGATPEHRNYWKREWLAYASGMLDTLPGELRAPRTLLTTAPADDECWIWMEDVQGVPGREWELDNYDGAAYDLATTQAAYACGRSVLPGDEWLSRHWLRGWVDNLARSIGSLDDDARWTEDWQAPMAALRSRVSGLWAAREELLAIVESAPQTVVHCDFWPTNLIAADDGTTVALDWSQVGIGSLAQDLDQLTLDPVWMLVLPDAPLDELEAHVVPSYLSGLRTSGVDVDESTARRWYAASAAVHYAPLAAMFAVDPVRESEIVESAEVRFRRPYAEIVATKARVVGHALELGERVAAGR